MQCMNLVVTSTLTQLILPTNLCPIFYMARCKQTARLGTGSVPARQTQAWRTLTTVQASSYDPPIIPTQQSDRVQELLAQFAEDDLSQLTKLKIKPLKQLQLPGIKETEAI